MRLSLRVQQGGRGSVGLTTEGPMAKVVNGLGRRALPSTSESSSSVASTYKRAVSPPKRAESESLASRAGCKASGSGRSNRGGDFMCEVGVAPGYSTQGVGPRSPVSSGAHAVSCCRAARLTAHA